jgi:hypothetical protein
MPGKQATGSPPAECLRRGGNDTSDTVEVLGVLRTSHAPEQAACLHAFSGNSERVRLIFSFSGGQFFPSVTQFDTRDASGM